MSLDVTGPLHDLINRRQGELGLADHALNKMLGFESPTALRLIKAGRMRLPITKVASLARALELPAGDLLELHLSECGPEVLNAIQECMGSLTITQYERRLLATIRTLSCGMPTSITPFRTHSMVGVIVVEESSPEGPLVSQEAPG